jgi:hypothetical protein
MFDLFKVPELDKAVKKTTDVTIKALEFQELLFKESLEFFNDITDKAFYTYGVQAEKAITRGTEYAKEALIKTGQLSKVSGSSK